MTSPHSLRLSRHTSSDVRAKKSALRLGTALAHLQVMRWDGLLAFALLGFCLLMPRVALAEETFVDGQTWGIEIGLGGGWNEPDSAYTRTLETFGFVGDFGSPRFRFSAALEKILARYFSLLLQTNFLGNRHWSRDSGIGPRDAFDWNTWTLDVHARAFLPIGRSLRIYAQFGIGPTFSGTRLYVRTDLDDGQTRYKDVDVGYNVAGLGGAEVTSKHVGLFVQGGYFYAPSPKNRLGDRHQSGGGLILAGLSAHFGRPQ